MDEPDHTEEHTRPRVLHGAQKRDWLSTVWQSLPIAVGVARRLAPTWEFASTNDLNSDFLRQHGIRGILWDVDGTLTHFHGRVLAPEAEPLKTLFEATDLRHAVVSNCNELRYTELSQIFPELAILKLYELADGVVGRRLERGRDLWFPGGGTSGSEQAPDAELVALRKPDARIIRFAVAQLGLPPESVLMVGDQYWTDVAGARLGGIRSAKLPTAGRPTFPPSIRAFQRLERWLRNAVA